MSNAVTSASTAAVVQLTSSVKHIISVPYQLRRLKGTSLSFSPHLPFSLLPFLSPSPSPPSPVHFLLPSPLSLHPSLSSLFPTSLPSLSSLFPTPLPSLSSLFLTPLPSLSSLFPTPLPSLSSLFPTPLPSLSSLFLTPLPSPPLSVSFSLLPLPFPLPSLFPSLLSSLYLSPSPPYPLRFLIPPPPFPHPSPPLPLPSPLLFPTQTL